MTEVGSYPTSVEDEYVEFSDEPDIASDTAADYAGGGDTFSHPDQTARIEIMQQVLSAITKALDTERSTFDTIKKSAVRVTTNLSGQVLFQRYTVPAGQAIQICREKDLRGNIIITNYSTTNNVFVGLHAGIMVAGSDTVGIGFAAIATQSLSRTIRTRNALWAIAAVACDIDVQEEFD